MDHPVVSGGHALVSQAKFSGQLGERPLVQNMSAEDVAVPFLDLAEYLLQPNGIKLRGRIGVDVHRDQAGNVQPGVIKALVVTDPASDTEEVDLSPLDGRL